MKKFLAVIIALALIYGFIIGIAFLSSWLFDILRVYFSYAVSVLIITFMIIGSGLVIAAAGDEKS